MADYDSSLPIRTENPADVAATITDQTGANNWDIDANGIGQVNLNDGTNALAIDASGNLTVNQADDKRQIWDGTDTLEVNSDGSINVNVVQSVVGDEQHIYGTSASIAPNTPTDVVTHTVTALKTFILKQIQASCAGKCKVEVKVAGSNVAVGFISTAYGSVDIKFAQPIEVAAGAVIKVTMTNKDNANTDLYAFINGNEV